MLSRNVAYKGQSAIAGLVGWNNSVMDIEYLVESDCEENSVLVLAIYNQTQSSEAIFCIANIKL